MHLLQINTVCNSGSTGRIVEAIGRLVQADGGQSTIAFGRGTGAGSTSKLLKVGSKADQYLHALGTRMFDAHGLFSKKATQRLIKLLETINPDIIHLHNVHGYYIHLNTLFAYLCTAKKPVVWTLHDCWPFTGHCTHFDTVRCERWKTSCYGCPLSSNYPSSWLLDRSTQNYQLKKKLLDALPNLTIVPVSYWLEGLVRESFLHHHVITTIHNGIDIEQFKPATTPVEELKRKWGVAGKFVVLGVASTWTPNKGFFDYIALSSQLPAHYVIVLVGLSKAQKSLLPSNIMGISRTESIEEMAEIYTMANVVLNLSYEETFGLTTVEGLACDTPGIVYNKTASPELLFEELVTMVEAADYKALLSNMHMIETVGKGYFADKCRTRAVEQYDKRNKFSEYIVLYHSLLNKR